MNLINIEGIERLECITVFTQVASELSGNLHLPVFCTQLCKGIKNLDLNESCCLFCASLFTVKVLLWVERGFNSHPGQSFSLSLCGPISISRANAHMVHMGWKTSTSHYTLIS